MTPSEKEYAAKLKKRLDRFDPVMNVWFHMEVIPRIPKFTLSRTFSEETLIAQIESLKNLKEVRELDITNIIQTINRDVATETLRLVAYQEILEYIDKQDIIFDIELRRILKIIDEDKRFANFYLIHTDNNDDDLLRINARLKAHYIKLLLEQISRQETNSGTQKIMSDVYPILNNAIIKCYKININLIANYKIILSLELNKNLTSLPANFIEEFENISNQYIHMKKISKIILERNLSNPEFCEWLYDYINRKVDLDSVYTPMNTKEKKELALYQLDYWYSINYDAYLNVLKKIQSSWNKRKFDKKTSSKIPKKIKYIQEK